MQFFNSLKTFPARTLYFFKRWNWRAFWVISGIVALGLGANENVTDLLSYFVLLAGGIVFAFLFAWMTMFTKSEYESRQEK